MGAKRDDAGRQLKGVTLTSGYRVLHSREDSGLPTQAELGSPATPPSPCTATVPGSVQMLESVGRSVLLSLQSQSLPYSTVAKLHHT